MQRIVLHRIKWNCIVLYHTESFHKKVSCMTRTVASVCRCVSTCPLRGKCPPLVFIFINLWIYWKHPAGWVLCFLICFEPALEVGFKGGHTRHYRIKTGMSFQILLPPTVSTDCPKVVHLKGTAQSSVAWWSWWRCYCFHLSAQCIHLLGTVQVQAETEHTYLKTCWNLESCTSQKCSNGNTTMFLCCCFFKSRIFRAFLMFDFVIGLSVVMPVSGRLVKWYSCGRKW